METRALIDRGLLSASPAARTISGKGGSMPKFVEAAVHGDVNRISEFLADMELNVNELDGESMSALHWACAYGEAGIVRTLLQDPRVDPCILNKRKGTPLHQATLCAAHDVLRVLLADPRVKNSINAANMWGETALILAATRGDPLAATILLEQGADPTLQDNWGKTAQEVASDHGEVQTASAIIDYISGKPIIQQKSITLPTQTSTKTRVLSKLLEAPLDEEQASSWLRDPEIDVNGYDYLKWTALHKCAAWEKPTVLRELLRHPKIEPTKKGQDGDSVLHSACAAGATRCVLILLEDERISVDETNNFGVSALMMGCGSGSKEIVEAVAAKADVNKATPEGKTAWNFAKEAQQEEIATFLWEKMSGPIRETSAALLAPKPKPQARAAGRKLSPQLLATQQAVIKPKQSSEG